MLLLTILKMGNQKYSHILRGTHNMILNVMWKFLTNRCDNNLCLLIPIYFLVLCLKFLKWRNLVIYDFRATIVFLYKIQMSQFVLQVHLSQISIRVPLSSLFQRKNNIIRQHTTLVHTTCIKHHCNSFASIFVNSS